MPALESVQPSVLAVMVPPELSAGRFPPAEELPVITVRMETTCPGSILKTVPQHGDESAMKLLYFATHQLWPLTSGNRLRDYHLARHLAARASVTFMEICHSWEQPSSPPDRHEFNDIISKYRGGGYSFGNVVRGMVGGTPLTVLSYSHARIRSALAEVLSRFRFDAVQIEGVQLSEHLSIILSAPNAPAVLVDWHNIESELMWRYSRNAERWSQRLVARRTAALLERSELRLLQSCGTHTVTSLRDKEQLLLRCPFANVHVVPNGVDTRYFSRRALTGERRYRQCGPTRSLIFVGSMDYHANVDAVRWFVREIWPAIAQKYPDLEFIIVGRNPTFEVRQLASHRIKVTGTVEDVRPYYASALGLVAPLRVGSGTRLKILEAMSAEVPVVSTRLGAEGIDVQNDVHLLLADSEAEFSAAIDTIATSVPTRSRLTGAARDLVVSRYDWSAAANELYRIHRDCLQTVA